MTILTRSLTLALITLLSLTGFALPAHAQAGRSKLDKVLREARRDATAQRVIVRAGPGGIGALRTTLARLGYTPEAEHPGLNAVTVAVRGQDLAALEADASAASLSTDAEVTAFGTPASAKTPHAPGAAARGGAKKAAPIGAGEPLRAVLGVTPRFEGAGINVAIVDSGIDGTTDIAPNIAGFWDFTAGGIRTQPTDEYGHGTHVAGLVASTGRDSNGELAGVAPRSRLYGFKVLDATGRGRASDVVSALEFIVASRLSGDPAAPRIDIINLSLGHPIYEPASTDPLVLAVERAARAGIVVVAAAGNIGKRSDGTPGYAGITSPGNAPSAITVGAADANSSATLRDDRVAIFSSRGPTWFDAQGKPDVVAPGVRLLSNASPTAALYQSYPNLLQTTAAGTHVGTLSGTSMAAAVATGVSSLIIEASREVRGGREGLTPNALKAVLQYTAVPLADEQGRPYDVLTQGTGAINARGALTLAHAIDTSMPAGSPWLRGRPEPKTVVGATVEPWSQTLLWAENIVWGTDVLEFNSLQWSTNIVWGTSRQQLQNIVWGTGGAQAANIVWGTGSLEDAVWGAAAGWMGGLVHDDRVIGQMVDSTNIVWGTLDATNIVWGTVDPSNIVWGTLAGQNIVWGTMTGQNIVWGTSRPVLQNIVWGTGRPQYENIVWGTSRLQLQNIVWGTGEAAAENIVWGTGDGLALAAGGAQ